jgi:hypothetical protein
MSSFDDRERAEEAKYAHDEELNFKINARRNRLLGEWVAGLLELDGADVEAYAKQVVIADFDRPGDEDVFEKIWADLQEKGVDISEHRVRKHMEDLMQTAREQVLSE